MVHIRFAQAPRWQAARRLGWPGRVLVGTLALGIGLAVALLALLSGLVFLAVTLVVRGWRAVAGPRRGSAGAPAGSPRPGPSAAAPARAHAAPGGREDATDVPFKELP
jgi:hypothetical protein